MGEFCRLVYFFIRCVQFSVTDIFLDRACEQVGILEHDAERMSQIRFFDLVDIDIVIADLAVRHIVETVDQVGDRSLARAGGSDEGQLLPRLCIQGQVMEHHMVRRISECHVIEAHIAFQLCVSDGSVRLMRMLPRPHAGALFALHDIALLIFLRIDKGHVAVVNLRFLIHHIEDTLRSGKRHDDGVELLRDLHERLCKALRKLQIRRHDSQRDISDAHYGEEAAEHCREHELQVPEISDDGSHHTCKCMCP